MYQTVTRKAIIIAAPGTEIKESFFNGVKCDTEKIFRYLQSPNGGSFRKSEIEVFPAASLTDLKAAFNNIEVSYLLIYFTGHGFTDKDTGKRFLCLQDNSIIEDQSLLISSCKKQLIIADTCRTILPTPVKKLPPFGKEQWRNMVGGINSRMLFDTCIRNSPDGKIIVHSTQNGIESYITSTGSYFTKELISKSLNINTGKDYTTYTIQTILEDLPYISTSEGRCQIPEVTYCIGNLTVPFAIEKSAAIKEYLLPQPKHNTWDIVAGITGIIILGGIIFGSYNLSNKPKR